MEPAGEADSGTDTALAVGALGVELLPSQEATDRFELGKTLLEPLPEPEKPAAPGLEGLPPPTGPQPGEALKQFSLAAAAGHQLAGLAAAKLHLSGDRSAGLRPSPAKAAGLLAAVVAGGWPRSTGSGGGGGDGAGEGIAGFSEAARLLGMLTAAGFASGPGEEPAAADGSWQNPLAGRAVALYRVAAAGGDPVAQLALGYRQRATSDGSGESCLAAAYYYRWVAQQSYKAVHTDKRSFYIEKKRLSADWVRPTENIDQGQRGASEPLTSKDKTAPWGGTQSKRSRGTLCVCG